MTGLAVKEAYDIGKGIYEWGKGKLSSAANKAAHHTRDKGGRILGAAWQHLGSPVVDATKKGAHAVKEGASKMIKGTTDFFIGRPLRFFFHERTQRDESGNVTKEEQWSLFKTPKNILKFFAWPFKTVGKGAKKFWDFFDYTPEKAAADKAWAEKRKAEKAAKKAKSGGGGHGGGGGGHH